jgi:hypothetical protein
VRGRDPVLAEWGWELEEPAPAVSARAASALALEALSWRAHSPRQTVVRLTYGCVHFAVSRPVIRLTAPESVGRRCAQLRGSGAELAFGPRLVHGAGFWMQTTGACQVGTSSAGSQRCLRSCMRAVVRPRCCTSCCTELTHTCQGGSVRLPLATVAPLESSASLASTVAGGDCLEPADSSKC